MSNIPRIAGAGICCLDHIIVAPQVPWGVKARIKDYRVQGGGLVGTAVVACARLGARTELFSMLGEDEIGEQILAELNEEGVLTAGVARFEGGTSPLSFVLVDEASGERTVFHRAAAGLAWKDGLVELDPIAGWGALLVDHYYPELSLAASAAARAGGVPVVGDMTPSEKTARLLKNTDVLIAPRWFAVELGLKDDLHAALDVIHKFGPTTAVITLGADGWVYSDPAGRGRGNAFAVEVVDTTGAGDAFHGAFAYGLALGWDTRRCCEFAAAVAAIKCTKVGGRTGLPSLARTLEFLKERSDLDWSTVG